MQDLQQRFGRDRDLWGWQAFGSEQLDQMILGTPDNPGGPDADPLAIGQVAH
ncbi:hypothetical protein D3C86_2020270 [compost metagenome]